MLVASLLAAGSLAKGQNSKSPTAPPAKVAPSAGASGELIRFSYRVVDGDLAKTQNDKNVETYLISQDKHEKLVVPSLEKVGQLRQSRTPVAGNTYWMAFSNQGRPIKPGDRVDIELSQFHVKGLLVQ
jgi:hypothetical protein